MKPIILIDFSKVVSPEGISRFISGNIAGITGISHEDLRRIYKNNISDFCTGKKSIEIFLMDIQEKYGVLLDSEMFYWEMSRVPAFDDEFIQFLQLLRSHYRLILASDVYKEMGDAIRSKLADYFDGFIFSFETGYKKSELAFWEKMENKGEVVLFIDDKQENIDRANEYSIKGILYRSFLLSKQDIIMSLSKK